MNKTSYYLLSASAAFNALAGIGTSFLPEEILLSLEIPADKVSMLFIQVLGAFLMGFAMINYLSRRAVIGGIYNKAILMGNITYQCISAIVFVKFILNHNLNGEVFIPLTTIYILLGIGFLRLNFVSPKSENTN